MVLGCRNCGGYFTGDELAKLKAPVHPWKLTSHGEIALAQNAASGQPQWTCPTCGHQTLRAREAAR